MLINEEKLIERFAEMAMIPSKSGYEREMCGYLQSLCQERGFTVLEDQAGTKLQTETGNLLVRIPGTVDAPALLFCAHMDTVSPEKVNRIIRKDGCLMSDGESILGSDDKAGIAAILEAVDTAVDLGIPRPPLELLFTVGEEIGLSGAKLFDYGQLQAGYGYVLDHGRPPGAMVLRSPSQYHIKFTVEGKAAHAGICPEQGINAIQVMAKALAGLPCGRLDAETTCNFGLIRGGIAENIVCPSCTLEAEVRSLDRDKLEALVETMTAGFIEIVEANGARAVVQKELIYSAARFEKEEPVVRFAAEAAAAIGLKVFYESTGGGSDASVINEHGIPCVNLGIGMSRVHSCEEFIRIQDLTDTARWVFKIIQTAAEL